MHVHGDVSQRISMALSSKTVISTGVGAFELKDLVSRGLRRSSAAVVKAYHRSWHFFPLSQEFAIIETFYYHQRLSFLGAFPNFHFTPGIQASVLLL